jgi:hypothetical protein
MTGCRAHPASYPVGTGIKQLGCEADHSPPSMAEIKNMKNCVSIPPYIFIVWACVKHRDNY